MPAAPREPSREPEHHELAVARCVRFCFVADAALSVRLLLSAQSEIVCDSDRMLAP